MIRRLRKVGSSYALILDRSILEPLGLEEGGPVQLTIQDGHLIISPADPSLVDAANVAGKIDQVVRKRRGVLRRLAY